LLKRIVIINIVLFFTITIYGERTESSENLAYKKQVIGTFNSLSKITDGIVSPSNYAESIKRQGVENFFIIVMGRAKYINKVKFYWVKGHQPLKYKVEIGKNLFEWESKFIHILKKENEKNGLIITTDNTKNTVGFFVKVTVLDAKKYPVRISEMEIYTSKIKLKVKIKDFKVVDIKEHSATIKFKTTYPTSAYVRVGETPHILKNYRHELDIYKEHTIFISDLLKGTTYYVQPVAVTIDGKAVMGKVYKFKTKGIPLPRVKVFNIYDTKKFSARLLWRANLPCKFKLFIGKDIKSLQYVYSDNDLKISRKFEIRGLIPETEFICQLILIDKFGNRTEAIKKFITKEDNIAYKKKTYGTFLYSEKNKNLPDFSNLRKITDGNLDVTGIALSGNCNQQEQVAIVDLGKVFRIRNIKIIWRAVDYPREFNVYIGKELKNMKLVNKKIDTKKLGKVIASHGTAGLLLREVSLVYNGKKARYIKVVIPQNAKIGSDLPFKPIPFVQLVEIKVFKIPDYGNPEYKVLMIE